jgi:DNA-directed RNA polymerase subunit alpha
LIGPFLKGQGLTVGAALRRVMLSNLRGLAITGVRIKNVDHEFASIPNLKEDVIELTLNLKQIILKGDIAKPISVHLNKKGPAIVLASDIQLPKNITLADPHQYIATLPDKGDVEMEFLIAAGQNYFLSTRLEYTMPLGFFAIDAVFMPVKKVNLFAEEAGSFHEEFGGLENIYFEVWTNGSIQPDEALSLSSEVLENTYGLLKLTDTYLSSTNKYQLSPDIEEAPPISEAEKEANYKASLMKIPLKDIGLSNKAYNCLNKEGVLTLFDLVQYSPSELLQLKGLGQGTLNKISKRLKDRFDVTLRNS